MSRTYIRFCVIIALLGLTACSPRMAEEAAMAEPVVVEDAGAKDLATDCRSTTAGDGIGGTGCPAID